MTGPTLSADPAEIALCLTCDRLECDGGSPDCPWGRVYWQERDPEAHKAYIREYNRRQRTQERSDERRIIHSACEAE